MFPDFSYANLEDPELRALAVSDPKIFFQRFSLPMIIDEIHRVPELLSWIQIKVDSGAENGSFVLTGSHQLKLRESISQSLAGRTSVLTLLPLSISEISEAGITLSKDEWLHYGFLPRIHGQGADPLSTYRNYFQTYVERDVRLLVNIRNVIQFENFIRLLAGRVGQVVNLENLSDDVGVSGTTLAEWLSVLEASFVVFRLPPYYHNFGKRLIKAPKIYFIEPGLAAWLLGIESPKQVSRDPVHGGLFENLVVLEALKSRYNAGKESNLYFWRDNNRNEVDLLFDVQRVIHPVEIKSAATWNEGFVRKVRHFRSSLPAAGRGAVVYAGDHRFEFDGIDALPFHSLSSWIKTLSE